MPRSRNAPFEARGLARLAEAVPAHARRLLDVRDRLVDLLPIVADNVYHPAFQGSFSINKVLPALVPDLGYADLEVADGGMASALLEALLLEPAAFAPTERLAICERLLAYCNATRSRW